MDELTKAEILNLIETDDSLSYMGRHVHPVHGDIQVFRTTISAFPEIWRVVYYKV